MLDDKKILEISDHLNRAQNPIFFFDNDSDGLCSFLLLQRFCERGKGIPIKSFPELTGDYFRKVTELNSDYIFILDKPLVSDEFFSKAREMNIPIVCIDHHDVKKSVPDFVNYYNPASGGVKGSGPTTYLCYQVSRKKEDLWIAVAGCIADRFFPDFYTEFRDRFPDLAIESEDAFEIRYRSGIGRITNLLSFALKDRTTNVVRMMKFLMSAKSPYEVLEESPGNHTMHQRFSQINAKYQRLMERAKKTLSNRLLFFQYSGDLSISSDIANELNYLFPRKYVVVAFVSGAKVNISARGKGIREMVEGIINGYPNSTGGGHDDAVGAKIRKEDLGRFKMELMRAVDK
jgi:single-stranded DNA-specific DHH superfamily exonuclease